ncbi:hypothetical protein LOTGIDRAFT_234412 [Lottia gigantea]|uniref:Small vasohibin-binding protein n=1 Tax=Lottia gigantea TaxID=225164 RepID=V4A6G8_LOTGI|nr:hypothetical protein LOTGIDRAFT_234412 [Lottia gigantea]ESO88836.1 hypothetical protein LOTGIDRAFT_234412 [Lottia gigantea]
MKMRNKSSCVDLPSVTKSASRLVKGKSKTRISLNFAANCSAIKIHDTSSSKKERLLKNSKFIKSVYGPAQSDNNLRTSSAPRIGRVNFSDVVCQISSSSPTTSPSKSTVANDAYMKKVTKIYQSQCQSGTVVVCGVEVPCAPPATPTPEQMKYHQYIPSLNDVMAQRTVKLRLEKIEKKEQKKQDRKREEEIKLEKMHQKDKLFEKRRKQRQEIYALNKIMTELENKRFEEFCKAKGIS